MRDRRVQAISGIFSALQVIAIVASIWLLAISLAYLSFSGYFDHFEASVAAMSWMLFQSDQPLYHGLQSAARYSASYGPMLYLLDGLPTLALGTDISTSKISGVIACAVAVFILFKTIRRNCELQLAIILIGLFVLGLLIFENYAYWNRPDPFLVLCVAIGLSQASTPSLRSAAIYVGVTTGIALNLKIHGAVYMLPVIALFLTRRPGGPTLLIAFSSFVVVFAAPFMLTQISVADYLASLTVAPRHGLRISLLATSIAYLLVLLAPLVGFTLIGSSRAPSPSLRILAAALLVELFVITIISGKRGAGPHHYLPVLPTLTYLCALISCGQAKDELLTRTRNLGRAFAGFALLAISYMVIASMAVRSQAALAARLAQDTEFREATLELRQIMANHPGSTIQMGYSDRNGYKLTFLRPLLVADGNPYWLDAGVLMDYDAAGIAMPADTINALETCKTQVWILPARGAPFSMSNYYATGRNIFSEEFRQVFFERYQFVQATRYYAIWTCRSGAN